MTFPFLLIPICSSKHIYIWQSVQLSEKENSVCNQKRRCLLLNPPHKGKREHADMFVFPSHLGHVIT